MSKNRISPPPAQEWTSSSHQATVALALDRIEAAAWLLDQVKVGELSFLTNGTEVPCWLSEVGVPAEELGTNLEHWAVNSISRAVQEVRENLPREKATATKAVA